MKYGYTIADVADTGVFHTAVSFVTDTLHYTPKDDILQDFDGSLFQTFEKDGMTLRLESNHQIDYVAIVSESELPIRCLNKWTTA